MPPCALCVVLRNAVGGTKFLQQKQQKGRQPDTDKHGRIPRAPAGLCIPQGRKAFEPIVLSRPCVSWSYLVDGLLMLNVRGVGWRLVSTYTQQGRRRTFAVVFEETSAPLFWLGYALTRRWQLSALSTTGWLGNVRLPLARTSRHTLLPPRLAVVTSRCRVRGSAWHCVWRFVGYYRFFRFYCRS